jgi:ubiquinone biosynthesis monooxygenase Coq7
MRVPLQSEHWPEPSATALEAHLRDHMERLPAADQRSRAIVEQMTHEEAMHGAAATAMGADRLPFVLRSAMRLTSQIMTRGSLWL